MYDERNDTGQQPVILWMQVGGLDDQHVRDSMYLFVEQVMPRCKGQAPLAPAASRNARLA